VAGVDGAFKDTRPVAVRPDGQESSPTGDGLYVNGMDVLLTYTVGGGTKISEQPGSVAADGQVAFTRTFKIEAPATGFIFKSHKVQQAFSLLVADVEGGTAKVDNGVVTFTAGDTGDQGRRRRPAEGHQRCRRMAVA
jgi:hypothetical protein